MNIQTALSLHQRGKLIEAEKIYKQLLAINPNDTNANYLYGTLLLTTERPKEALALLQMAYASSPVNAPVWYALMQACYRLGRFENVEAYYLEGIKASLNDAKAHKLAAQTASAQGRFVLARERYQLALSHLPNNKHIRHDLAVVERQLGNYLEAKRLLESLIQEGLNDAHLFHNYANVLSDTNQMESAADYYRRAIELDPTYVPSYENLSSVLLELGHIEDFLTPYTDAINKGNGSEALLLSYVGHLLRLNQMGEVDKLLRYCEETYGRSPQYVSVKLQWYRQTGQMALFEETIRPYATDDDFAADWALFLIEQGRVNEASAATQHILAKYPHHQLARAYHSVAASLADNSHQDVVNDYDLLVGVYDLTNQVRGMEASTFLANLSDYLRQKHQSSLQPLYQTVQGGTQTRGNVLHDDHLLIDALRTFFSESVLAHSRHLNDQVTRDSYRPRLIERVDFIGAWSVLLRGQGYHNNHIHPEGTLSAVFYVDVPMCVETDAPSGWLTFGQPNISLTSEFLPAKMIQPKPGRLVVFPSYFWHGTVPIQNNEERLTIAFDVVNGP